MHQVAQFTREIKILHLLRQRNYLNQSHSTVKQKLIMKFKLLSLQKEIILK